MKRLNLLFAAVMVSSALFAQTAAQQLIARMKSMPQHAFMVGHQDATVYGKTWKWDEGRCDIYELTGDYPAIVGFDLGKLELDSEVNLDGVPFARMHREILAQHARGGIVTLSWHPWNPVTGENAWDPEGKAVKECMPGGSQHGKFDAWLTKVANFINSLRTYDGQKVPVIFRPWHEMSGGWFWWGCNSCSPKEYIDFYRYTHDQLEKKHGCDNIVWAYSPNVMDGEDNYQVVRRYYPGAKYVDLVGFDIYEFDGNDEAYVQKLTAGLKAVNQLAAEEGKLGALTETGCRNVGRSWFTKVLAPVLFDNPVSYVLFWRNAWDNPDEAYVPARGDKAATDFVLFTHMNETLFISDIKDKK